MHTAIEPKPVEPNEMMYVANEGGDIQGVLSQGISA